MQHWKLFLGQIVLLFLISPPTSGSPMMSSKRVRRAGGVADEYLAFHSQAVHSRCVIPGVVALTFDDGPSLQTLKVLDVLRDENVTATFFITGNIYINIDNATAQAIVQRTINEGHYIASHTWSHPNLTRGMPLEDINYEMNHLSDKVLQIFGKRLTIMRPPYGDLNWTVVDILGGQLGYEIVTWSIDTFDWEHIGDIDESLRAYSNALNGTTVPSETLGFISLQHDPLPHSDELATRIIHYVRKAGYRFVTLHDCLGIPTPVN